MTWDIMNLKMLMRCPVERFVIWRWENKTGNTSALLSRSKREEELCCGSHTGVMMPTVREKQHQWHCMLRRWEWNVSHGLSFKGGGLSRSGGGWKDNIAGAEKVDDPLLFFSEWPHKYSPYKLTPSRCIRFFSLTRSSNPKQKQAV